MILTSIQSLQLFKTKWWFSLLNTEQNQWDVDLLRDVFEERDVNLILAIPINVDSADTWYWKKEKMGHFSVKTAYSLVQELRGVQRTSDNSGFWWSLWNLKIPAKVKFFLWSAAIGCLSTKDKLKTSAGK